MTRISVYENNSADTAIHYAAMTDNAEVMKVLFDRRRLKATDIKNHRNERGNTTLRLAVRISEVRVVKALSERGVDINVKNNNGDTPLHLIARIAQNLPQWLRYWDTNFDTNTQNKNGNTIVRLAAIVDKIRRYSIIIETRC